MQEDLLSSLKWALTLLETSYSWLDEKYKSILSIKLPISRRKETDVYLAYERPDE